jgi:hypothetical protein
MECPKRGRPQRLIYTCDVCGREGNWDDGFVRYSSILLDEECPHLVPHICVGECQKVCEERVKLGEWVLPKVNKYGRVTRKPKGYGDHK